MTSTEPHDPPPSYEKATGKSSSHKNDIPTGGRRSMEDEQRGLPKGWVRQYDDEHGHQFFVDTTKEPPRSIWHHPYDDDEYLDTLTPEERNNIFRMHKSTSFKVAGEDFSDDESHAGPSSRRPAAASASSSSQATGFSKIGRKLKDKITSSTHEEREQTRQQKAEQEQKAYEAHLAYRQAMTRAAQTGEPQPLGKDRDGREVYIEPPNGPGAGFYGPNQYGYNPYAQGPYTNPNARFIRPNYAYSRPYGYGYGGGLGLPLGAGLLGGALLGAALF